MDLVLAILHVHQRAVLAIKELGIALAALSLATLLEDEMVFTITGEYTIVALALNEVGIVLHDRLEVNAEIGIFNHSRKILMGLN